LFDFHGGAVTKIEIVEALAEKTGMQKKDAESVLETLVNTIQESLKTGQKVNLAGLGTFVVVEKKARVARNPKTGETVQVDAKKAPKFKPGKQLKELLAGLTPTA
jgi:DNA-binding protein HU-beta